MTSIPVLSLPKFGDPFTMDTDVSEKGITVALMQEGRTIALISKALIHRSQSKLVYEKELMVLLYVVSQWPDYSNDTPFII